MLLDECAWQKTVREGLVELAGLLTLLVLSAASSPPPMPPLAYCLHAMQGSPSSKGCGLVVMRSYADAAAAIAGLDSYKWEGMHSAMVVKVMPPQRQRQEQSAGQGQAAGSGESDRLGSSMCRVLGVLCAVDLCLC